MLELITKIHLGIAVLGVYIGGACFIYSILNMKKNKKKAYIAAFIFAATTPACIRVLIWLVDK